MRRKLFAGNWKMNLTAAEARALIVALRAELEPDREVLSRDRDVMVAPAFPAMAAAAEALAGSGIALGAQNMYFEDKGAFTGEVSVPMLKVFGVSHVIIGHSERRHIFGETDTLIARKLRAALAHGLTPILCIGETEAERGLGRTLQVVLGQLERALDGLGAAQLGRVVLAYEPVWAIGTGRNASPQQAEQTHAAIRGALAQRWEDEIGQAARILYGGSVTPQNVDSLVGKPDIDGALVGGASLIADSFARIVRARTGS